MKTLIKTALITTFSLTLSTAYAHTDGFATDSSGKIVTDGKGECVSFGKLKHDHDHMGKNAQDCGKPKEVAKPAPKPEPKPAPKPVVHETITLGASALFDTNKSDIRPAARAELDDVAAKLKAYFAVDAISVVGHTDSRGSEKYNQGLSERRANSVRNYLISKGIDGSKIVATGEGELKPVADNKTKEGRQANRRVVIDIRARK